MSNRPASVATDDSLSSDTSPHNGTATLPPPQPSRASSGHRKWVLLFALLILFVGGIVAFIWYLDARQYESTDDAFIDGHVVDVSPRIAGHVIKVLVDDNQLVKAGDPLVELDPATLKNKIVEAEGNLNAALATAQQAKTNTTLIEKTAAAGKEQGEAGLVVAKAAVETAKATIDQNQSQVTADEANAHKSDLDLARYQNLLKTGDVTQQQVDAAIADTATAHARLDASRKSVTWAQAQLQEALARVTQAQGQFSEVNVVPERTAVSERQADTADAQIQQLQAALDQAKLNLTYTTILSPIDGRITRRSVETGNYLSEGQVILAIVPKDLYITANFKETQLRDMKPGQPVTIKIDAYPDVTFNGHIDSLQQGSGSRFSMLPPENATGNFVKVVQRIPVKIDLDQPFDANRDYAPGMSAEPRVKVR